MVAHRLAQTSSRRRLERRDQAWHRADRDDDRARSRAHHGLRQELVRRGRRRGQADGGAAAHPGSCPRALRAGSRRDPQGTAASGRRAHRHDLAERFVPARQPRSDDDECGAPRRGARRCDPFAETARRPAARPADAGCRLGGKHTASPMAGNGQYRGQRTHAVSRGPVVLAHGNLRLLRNVCAQPDGDGGPVRLRGVDRRRPVPGAGDGWDRSTACSGSHPIRSGSRTRTSIARRAAGPPDRR